jgi:TPR repeat protein
LAEDRIKAPRLIKAAADKDCEEDQAFFGSLYHYGRGVQVNIPGAVKLYRLALANGCKNVKFNLGACLVDGTDGEAEKL